ncbi:MAG: hypothetical protein M1508_09495 [Nitrospirae bacterium]|nr:hypothetical protein [Nitrospirota bacterium]MCL5421983.1 hypothetical protein [Nitrospirota bacterium]
MPKKIVISAFVFFMLSSVFVLYCQTQLRQGSEKISTGYANILSNSGEALRIFNKRIKVGFLSSLLKRKAGMDLSVEGQLSEKVDIIVERVKMILEMHPRNFNVQINVLPDAQSVRAAYRKKYYRDADFVAFYAPAEKAIYIAADEAKANILAHELAHAVIDQFFGVAAPTKIHEILAQYVDENFED